MYLEPTPFSQRLLLPCFSRLPASLSRASAIPSQLVSRLLFLASVSAATNVKTLKKNNSNHVTSLLQLLRVSQNVQHGEVLYSPAVLPPVTGEKWKHAPTHNGWVVTAALCTTAPKRKPSCRLEDDGSSTCGLAVL